MKHVTAIAMILLVFVSAHAQPIIIQKKDSSKVETNLRVFSRSKLHTSAGYFNLKDISKLYLGGHDVKLESYAKNCGIQTSVKDLSMLQIKPFSEEMLTKEVLSTPVTNYYQNPVLQFKSEREAGTLLEGLGLVMLTIAITQKNQDRVRGLAYGGGAVIATGYVVRL